MMKTTQHTIYNSIFYSLIPSYSNVRLTSRSRIKYTTGDKIILDMNVGMKQQIYIYINNKKNKENSMYLSNY